MSDDKTTAETAPLPALGARAALGGLLMGLANLVPGISGGTMLLAAGVYQRFITAVAEVTTLRFRFRSLYALGVIVVSAGLAIVLLAGPTKHLVETRRWIMYSLFIGLTLGGVPLVWKRARPATPAVFVGATIGFGVMVAMLLAGPTGTGVRNPVMLAVAGIAGASAMVLPGISGAYMLLVLGQYEVILGAIDQCKQGLGGDFSLITGALPVVVPVGIGVAVGIAGISNLVRWALDRHGKITLGILLGLLFGSVLGIWPFQEAVEVGEPRVLYAPHASQAIAAIGLAFCGLLITILIGRLGREPRSGH